MQCSIVISGLSLLISSALLAGECIPTAQRSTGTHYQPVTQHKKDIGEGVRVYGKVLSIDCRPVVNAKVAHWQAGNKGRYTNRLRAFLYTDAQGGYEFKTEWPSLNPPHIHFIVTAEGHEILETQWIGDTRVSEIQFNMVLERKP